MFSIGSSRQFDSWWRELGDGERDAIAMVMRLLQERGPTLQFPYSSRIRGSRHRQMRELRVQHMGRPYRILYVFNPKRSAILLVGGRKDGSDRWYLQNIPRADRLYDQHLTDLQRKDLL
jgi:hypothetical protein